MPTATSAPGPRREGTKSGPKSSPKSSKIEFWGGLGRLLEPIGVSWPCFGASWGCFGSSWARLGRLRGVLGGVFGRPGAVLEGLQAPPRAC